VELKGQDILVALKLAASPAKVSYAELGRLVGLSASQAFSAVQRASRAGLIVGTPRRANTHALLEFLVHGVKYGFPPVRGPSRRGMPTAHSAEPLLSSIRGNSEPLVWADAEGDLRGETLKPLYKSAPFAAKQDANLYAMLALVDAIRAGRARERDLAARKLEEILTNAEQV